MMDDDAWRDYTDETLEQFRRQFEVEIEFKRRARFLRSQGFTFKRIAELLNEQGVKNSQGRNPTSSGVYQIAGGVEMQQGHSNRGRQWSEETRRRVDEGQEARRNGFRSVDAYNDWKSRYQAMRARFSDD